MSFRPRVILMLAAVVTLLHCAGVSNAHSATAAQAVLHYWPGMDTALIAAATAAYVLIDLAREDFEEYEARRRR